MKNFKEHWVKNTFKLLMFLVLGYVVYIILLFAYIHYLDSKSYKIDSKLPDPLSTRGLPVPATDVPIILPPDPGELGKTTLAGIDSNNDGVRDDLEREIIYMHPQNEEARRVLRAMVKKGQEVITTSGDHDHFEELMVSYFGFSSCYDILIFGPRLTGFDSEKTDILWKMIQNTPERENIFKKNSNKGTPFATDVASADSCKKLQGKY